MIYYVRSDNSVYFLNEYFIIVPVGSIVFSIITSKIKKRHRIKMEQMRHLLKLEKQLKFYKIAAFTFGTTTSLATFSTLTIAMLVMRGGDDTLMGDVSDFLSCNLGSEPAVINNSRIREYIVSKFSRRAVKNLIYITSQALCFIIKKEGVTSLPIAHLKFIGVTSWLEVLRKVAVFSFTGVPIWYGYYIYTTAAILTVTSVILTLASLVSGIYCAQLNPYAISATKLASIDGLFKARIPGQTEVVYLTVSDQFKKKLRLKLDECALPDQSVFNKKCRLPSPDSIPDTIVEITKDLPLDVEYGDIVSMSDVLKTPKTVFNDKPRLQEQSSSSSQFQIKSRARPRPTARTVKFTDKVKEWNANDPDSISDIHGNLRGRIKDDL